MAASKQMISQWFDEGKRDGARYMIVCCDTFDHEDYPVYTDTDEQAWEQFHKHDNKNMQRVMEVYDLNADKEEQLTAFRAFRLPRRS